MNSFTFYGSYYEAIQELPENEQGNIYKAIIDYAMTGQTPNLQGAMKMAFILIKPNIDNSIKQSKNRTKQEPNKNQIETKRKPNKNQIETKQEPLHQDNIKETDKDKDYLLVKEILNNSNTSSSEDLNTSLFNFIKIRLVPPNFFDYHENTIYGKLAKEVIELLCKKLIQSKEKAFVYEGEKFTLEKMINFSLKITSTNVEFIVKSLKVNEKTIKNRELYIFSALIQQVRQCEFKI